ncbi:MAG: hypothetical protein AAB798_00030 [Patescibacteria group bacterium]
MNTAPIAIPRQLQTRVRRHAREYDVTPAEYVRTALENALKNDEELSAEMEAWENASIRDFNAFAREHKL